MSAITLTHSLVVVQSNEPSPVLSGEVRGHRRYTHLEVIRIVAMEHPLHRLVSSNIDLNRRDQQYVHLATRDQQSRLENTLMILSLLPSVRARRSGIIHSYNDVRPIWRTSGDNVQNIHSSDRRSEIGIGAGLSFRENNKEMRHP